MRLRVLAVVADDRGAGAVDVQPPAVVDLTIGGKDLHESVISIKARILYQLQQEGTKTFRSMDFNYLSLHKVIEAHPLLQSDRRFQLQKGVTVLQAISTSQLPENSQERIGDLFAELRTSEGQRGSEGVHLIAFCYRAVGDEFNGNELPSYVPGANNNNVIHNQTSNQTPPLPNMFSTPVAVITPINAATFNQFHPPPSTQTMEMRALTVGPAQPITTSNMGPASAAVQSGKDSAQADKSWLPESSPANSRHELILQPQTAKEFVEIKSNKKRMWLWAASVSIIIIIMSIVVVSVIVVLKNNNNSTNNADAAAAAGGAINPSATASGPITGVPNPSGGGAAGGANGTMPIIAGTGSNPGTSTQVASTGSTAVVSTSVASTDLNAQPTTSQPSATTATTTTQSTTTSTTTTTTQTTPTNLPQAPPPPANQQGALRSDNMCILANNLVMGDCNSNPPQFKYDVATKSLSLNGNQCLTFFQKGGEFLGVSQCNSSPNQQWVLNSDPTVSSLYQIQNVKGWPCLGPGNYATMAACENNYHWEFI